MAGPLISVVIPAYQAADTLGATLRSILGQTHAELEVLVVDDGSTDTTAELIRGFAAGDSRVVGVSYGGNRGRSHARNEGIRRANGEWVAMVDADDLLAHDRFEQFLAAVDMFPDTSLVTDDRIGWWLDAGGRVQLGHRQPGRHTWRIGPPHRLDRRRHYTDRFGHLDLMVRRDFLTSSGVTYPEDVSTAEDLTFYNTLLFWPEDPRPVRVAQPTYRYRLWPTARAAGTAESRVLMARRVAAATGSREFQELEARWSRTHYWLSRRVERQQAAEGRLEPPAEAVAGIDPPPVSPLGGVTALVGLKALQWLSQVSDRRLRPAIVAEIESQLEAGR